VGEQAPGATTSIKASVEYPAGTFTQILFSASATGTIPDGGTLISDYLTISIPNGDRYWIRTYRTNSVGLPVTSGIVIDHFTAFMGDCYEVTSTDRTMTGEVPDADNMCYYPAVISPTTAPSVLIVGDSIALGKGDVLDLSGDQGIVARTTGPGFGYFNAAVDGEKASDFVSNHTQRLLAAPFCTHVFVNYGRNDIYLGGDSAATVEGNLTTIYGYFSTKTVKQLTLVPDTTSSDSWVTTANQTVVTGETARATVNSDLRSSFHPAGGISDTGAVLETSTKWIATSGIARTGDGIHPNNLGYINVRDSGAINTALIGTPATPATETGSAWGAIGSDLTVSTRRRSNDTITRALGNTWCSARGAGSNSSGKKYFEIEILSGGGATPNVLFNVGLANGTTSTGAGFDTFIGNIDDSFGIYSGGGGFAFVGGTIFTAVTAGSFDDFCGDVFGVAVDFTNKFAYVSRNGIYLPGHSGSTGDPTSGGTGTGYSALWTGTPTLYPAFTFGNIADASARIRTVQLLNALPSGYSAWG
jgi:hypothetical protein